MDLVTIFKESKELKRFIYKRTAEHNIPLRYLCLECGIKYGDFMDQYINVTGHSKIEITELQINKILDLLGVSVRFNFIVNEEIDMNTRSSELAYKYQQRADKEKAKDDQNKRTTSRPTQSDNSFE